ncbi:MAG: WbqC family protein [Bacteroidales bacterium]|nr:WbqC family protein [Bacteroidales bacterium]
MTLGIMQPYFFPYIGYFQLLNAVDQYVIYDNIQYTKKGWVNRNRILQNGMDVYLTLSIEKASDFLDIKERFLSESFDRSRMIRQIKDAYGKAPFYSEIFPLIERVVFYEERNLFLYLYHSILEICSYLDIKTSIKISSEIDIDHSLRGQAKVLAFCSYLKADNYINAIGGVELYDKSEFHVRNVNLKFLQVEPFSYKQYSNEFVPYLSIIDVLMFNGRLATIELLDKYRLI